jgi:hypothetical protein
MRGAQALSWDTCVHATEYITDYDRLYLTGREPEAEVCTFENGLPAYHKLGVPAPLSAPTIAAPSYADYGREFASRSYLYTYINKYDEESSPSPVSPHVTVANGDTVTVSGLAYPPNGYDIIGAIIYRSATGFRSGTEKEQERLTDYLRVAEIRFPVTSFSDTLKDMYLGPVVTTRDDRMPPAGLRCIRHINGTGTLVAVTGNTVHFSADYQPWNWPAVYDLTLPANIINMTTVDKTVYVTTDAQPFVIDGTPICEPGGQRQVLDIDVPLPDTSCGYAHSIAPSPFGAIYSTAEGLVLLQPDGKFNILTAKTLGPDKWTPSPDVRLAFWRNYVVCATGRGPSLLLDIDPAVYGDSEEGSLTTLSDDPVDLCVTESGQLLMLEDDAIWQFDAGSQYRPYQWMSRPLGIGGQYSPVAAKVKTDNTTLIVEAVGTKSRFSRKIFNDNPVRVRRLGRHLEYSVGFEGVGMVDLVYLEMTNLKGS